jgi:hypothetical protein
MTPLGGITMARKTSTHSKTSWRELEGERKRIGQSVAAFCRERRLNPAGLYAWRRHAKMGAARQPSHTTGDFLPVTVVESVPAADLVLEIELRGGRLIRLRGETTPARLAVILKALEADPC